VALNIHSARKPMSDGTSTINVAHQRERLNLQESSPWLLVLLALVPSSFDLNRTWCTNERYTTHKRSLRGSLTSFKSVKDGTSTVNTACQRERLHLHEVSQWLSALIILVPSAFGLKRAWSPTRETTPRRRLSLAIDTCYAIAIGFRPE
jgi:hypothetical protein